MSSGIVESQVLRAHRLISEAMNTIVGKHITFPRDTNPINTYQFRMVKQFLQHLECLELSDSEFELFIKAAVKYAHGRGLVSQYITFLTRRDIIEHCIHYIRAARDNKSDIDQQWAVMKRLVDNIDDDQQPHPIITLYQSGKISIQFLAISNKCLRALARLQPCERSLMPDNKNIVFHRQLILGNKERRKQALRILKSDFCAIGVNRDYANCN